MVLLIKTNMQMNLCGVFRYCAHHTYHNWYTSVRYITTYSHEHVCLDVLRLHHVMM